MELSQETTELMKEAARDAQRPPLTTDEILVEVMRLCLTARTPEEVFELGRLFGSLRAVWKHMTASVAAPAGPERADD